MWRYYLDVTKFSGLFSALFCLFFASGGGFFYALIIGLIVFGIFGTVIGLIGFNYFHATEYYTYYNLGFTKAKLIRTTYLINLVLATVCTGLAMLLNLILNA